MRYIYLVLSAIITFAQVPCWAKQRATNFDRPDGFGAQFQTLIYAVIYADLHDMEFVYTPFKKMEHNYSNDPDYLAQKEWLINFKDNFEINNGDTAPLDWSVMNFFEKNLELCTKSSALQKIKRIFRENKNPDNYFATGRFNIVLHVRRPNSHDNRIYGADIPDDYYLKIINKLRVVYSSKKPIFHIHSQGSRENYQRYASPDIVLHLDESVEDSFTQMVLADVLVTSPSSFSYVAGILSGGIVYYMSFWHPPLPDWIPLDTIL